MAKSRLRSGCVYALLGTMLGLLSATAQETDSALKTALINSLQVEKKLTDAQRRTLSNATQNRFALAHQMLEVKHDAWRGQSLPMFRVDIGLRAKSAVTGPAGMVAISSPAFDYTLSRGGGFSQNDTSTAWCGPNIVTGYNDSSAILMLLQSGTSGLSFSGVAHSEDGGSTFTDLGYLDPGPSTNNFLVGNPSVACANEQRFYYASMFATAVPVTPTKLAFKEAIGVNVSTDGGRSWSQPMAAVLKNPAHIIERESLAIDPADPQRLYISYTDLSFEIARTGPCAGDTQMTVEFVSSSNGGNTWTKPQIIERVCNSSGNATNGSQVAVGPSGQVYVAYMYFDNINSRQLIRVRRSDNQGKGFRKAVDATTVMQAGSDGMLQGLFLSNEYPSLAVDRSSGPNRGTAYLAWTDGRNHSQIDLFSANGSYNFADVLLIKSTDQGGSWSLPAAVSPAAPDQNRDQFMPGVAVDSAGNLAVCYSDRRNDLQNEAIDRYCSISQDGGATFHDRRLTDKSWSPAHASDLVLNRQYMQDYDVVSPDWTGGNAGFFGAFQFQTYGNPGAYGARF